MHELDNFISQKPLGRLYHYTGAAGAIGIIQRSHLWATDYRHLNDRREYRLGAKLLNKEIVRSKLDEVERKAL